MYSHLCIIQLIKKLKWVRVNYISYTYNLIFFNTYKYIIVKYTHGKWNIHIKEW